MKNLVQISNDLCSLVGSPWAQLEQEDRDRIVNDINSAIQEITVLGPTHLRQHDEAYIGFAPIQLTGCTFTTRSKTWAPGSPAYDAIWNNCGIIAGGDTFLNRIISDTELIGPALSASFDGTAKVYGDSFPLPDNFIAVQGPVWINGKWKCIPILSDTDRLALIHAEWGWHYYGQNTEYNVYWNYSPNCYNEFFYWIDNRDTKKFLRIWPAPKEDIRITFKGEYAAMSYTEDEIRQGAEIEGDPIVPPILADQHELILLPICRKKFSGWIHFNSMDALPQINTEYGIAYEALTSMTPQRQVAQNIHYPQPYGCANGYRGYSGNYYQGIRQ